MAGKKGTYIRGKVSIEAFSQALNDWMNAKCTVYEAAKRCGLSYPTFRKLYTKLERGEYIPDDYWSENVGVEDESEILRLYPTKLN